ncbi:MAG: ribonuclease HII [Bacillota bacterium]
MRAPSLKRLRRCDALYRHDCAWAAFGASLAGMDEAGRGPLLGSVVAACVIMPKSPVIAWIDDSKKLTPARREQVLEDILLHALAIGVGEASAAEIDEINILNATRLAMERAAASLPATVCLVDAMENLPLAFPTVSIIHGDALSYSIAAASIVAKVTRDRQIVRLAELYPQYGLEQNKGYGTPEHIGRIMQFGACPEHRRSFIGKYIGETVR